MTVYSIVVPVYNEELVVDEAHRRVKAVMDAVGEPYELIFVDDGSRDRTFEMLRELASKSDDTKVLSLSRNFGHQAAITAGMDYAAGQAVVVIDADMQDPPEVIPAMAAKWKEGWQVVYGRRSLRQGETAFKKLTAKLFYRFLNAMTDIKLPVDAGDFRLLDRKVIEVMKTLPERNRYVRGLTTWVGFRQTHVEYERSERFAGETKYPLKKMLRFAADGIASFSSKPLRLANVLGTLLCVTGAVTAVIQLICGLNGRPCNELALWAAAILFSQGMVLICNGIQGAYLARMYDESKSRPIYIVNEKIGL